MKYLHKNENCCFVLLLYNVYVADGHSSKSTKRFMLIIYEDKRKSASCACACKKRNSGNPA